ncbi:cob(I)yrinic acid a,c-diamide adenosyltransferase [Dechloromonas agitata]|uniref:Corrinoid adenosyltransferase n=1 Tax=Dechloromonas agitata TaxID=73030 RepID=A0A930FXU8_9RHOO|nr:cob(I)yrinic acid a,c-diamide adenosyltransferase [Dechloromonas agitata]MBF1163619.1 cob(I)yrinic acid a,c-diamide adenosyltransferase [Dechloromonas agitata]MDE1544271.1 cob(I)yrinic acid a,c-diamide adenosyltransferase [Dechloromonas agitata]
MNVTHEQRMQKKKAVVDGKIAAAQEERGVLVVNTGNGKGKSSAAFGVVARALGHGLQVGVVQFVKGRSDTGEEAFFRRQPGVHWHVGGEGFTWETQDKDRDARAAQAAWDVACGHLSDPAIGLVVLDEMTYAFKYGWLDLDTVIAKLLSRPLMQHVIITGRAAPEALREVADTVSDIGMEKHAFQSGIKAMPGLEF